MFDQSIFVRAALNGVISEAALAAALTAADDPALPRHLAQHRSSSRSRSRCRSSARSCASAAFGQTINSMTLGGLALAVGILVDDATVDDRKHRPQPRAGKAVDPGDPRRRPADRHAGLCLHPLHLHRLRAHLPAAGHRQVSFSARSRWPSSSRCSPRISSRGRSCRPSCTTCSRDSRSCATATSHGPRGDAFWRIHRRFNRHFERFRDAYVRAARLEPGPPRTVVAGRLSAS